MTLSHDIIKEAMLGTSNENFLLDLVTANLKQAAGYIPDASHLPLPRAALSNTTSLCSTESVLLLQQILRGLHRYTLREWLITAIRAGRHLPETILPKLLLIGLKHETLRPYIRRVIGQKGVWLATEISNQNWSWVLETPEYDVDDVILLDRVYEADLIQAVQNETFSEAQEAFSVYINKHQIPWSHQLTDAFMACLERDNRTVDAYAAYWLSHYMGKIVPLAYFLPMDRQLIKRMKQTPVLRQAEDHRAFEEIESIWAFRQEVIRALGTP